MQINYCMIDSVRTSIAFISRLSWINADRLTSLGPMDWPDYVCDADGMDFFLESKPELETAIDALANLCRSVALCGLYVCTLWRAAKAAVDQKPDLGSK